MHRRDVLAVVALAACVALIVMPVLIERGVLDLSVYLGVVAGIVLVVVLLMVWARRRDEYDLEIPPPPAEK
jgi:hypothetical protein